MRKAFFSFRSSSSSSSAKSQSYGLIDSISQNEWSSIKKQINDGRKKQDGTNDKKKRFSFGLHHHDKSNQEAFSWDTEFSCPNEESIIVGMNNDNTQNQDTNNQHSPVQWWICEPQNIAKAAATRTSNNSSNKGILKKLGKGAKSESKSCLVYTSSGKWDDDYTLEKALLGQLGDECEIHMFNPNAHNNAKDPPDQVYLHPWGFVDSSIPSSSQKGKLKSFQDTVKQLDHEDRFIDVLMLDCEGCEIQTYHDWFDRENLGASFAVQQIIVNMRSKDSLTQTDLEPYNNFFSTLTRKEGYAIFHSEKDESSITNHESYSFLRLSPEVFI